VSLPPSPPPAAAVLQPPESTTPGTEPLNKFSNVWQGWFRSVWKVLAPGVANEVVVIPSLTVGGSTGSITILNGIVTKVVQPT